MNYQHLRRHLWSSVGREWGVQAKLAASARKAAAPVSIERIGKYVMPAIRAA